MNCNDEFNFRLTTEAPTTTSQAPVTTTTIPRRRNPIFTEKTVLNSNTNSDQTFPSHDTLEITHLFKNIATDIEQETLIANRHTHDEDESNQYNIIALPTESVTENLPFPETVTTITTQSPNSNTQSPSINQVNDSLNEIFDSITAESATDSNTEYTTIINDLLVDASGDENLSKKDESFVEKSSFIAPRPFSRTTFPSRNTPSSRTNSPTASQSETTSRRRSRPTIVRTSTEIPSSQEAEEQVSYSRRPTLSYSPGYRGTARFRFQTTKSGEYDPKAIFDAQSINQQLLDENRLRSLNLERSNKRPSTIRTSPSTTKEPEQRPTRRRPTITRASTTTTEEPESSEESTTEYRIIEAKNRFNLKNDDRPDRLRFELTAGGKINFGFSSVKSRESTVTPQAETTDSSKVKVITGPLDKSPIISSGRNYKKGFVEEIPIQTSPETVTIRSFSRKLDLNNIPLNKSDIASFVADEDLKTDSPIVEDSTTLTKRFKLRPSLIGFRKRPANSEEEEITTEQTVDEETTTKASRLRPIQGKFVQREKSRVETEIKNELSDEIASQRISTRNRIAPRGRERTRVEQTSEAIETSSPRGFQSRQKTTEESEEVTQGKYLTRVRVSDIINKQGNAIEDSENSETQDAPEESTLRTRVRPGKGFIFSADIGEFVTESSSDDDNEVDFTTEEADEETTNNPIFSSTRATPHRLTIRKRPAKKIDFHATRQTITEAANRKDNYDSSFTSTPDDYEVDIESASSPRNVDVRTRPTRARFVTRKRIITGDDEVNQKIDDAIERPTATSPRTTTKKRVLIIRTKSGAIKSEVDIIPSTDEPSTEATRDDIPKIDDPDVTRRRLKIIRLKATTERVSEESTHKSIVARTRVFKRPTSTPATSESEQSSTSPRSPSRFSTRRRVVKVNRKPVGGENENEKTQDLETVSESSTNAPKKHVFKVLKQKTPRVIADKPLEEDSLVIKTDDQNQQIDENEESVAEENSEITSDEPSARPVLKYPTRPGGRVSSVTIRRRPFTQGSRTSTVHPASTRTSKDGVPPTRPRVTIRRRFKPSGATSETSVPVADEIDNEKRIALGERNKKIFKTKYRKFSTSTSSPNITPHNSEINTDSETDYEELPDSTDIPINNDGTILQPTKPRFSLKSRFTTSTTAKPTTLHHVFAIDEDENSTKNGTDENSADKVIDKLQKLIEINRIVEVYSKEEKLKLLKNKKLKSIKEGELTVEKPPALDKFGEISRQVVIKLKKKPTTTTELPEDVKSPKSVMFAETVFGNAETSTISLEGLFKSEKMELELQKESEEKENLESIEKQETSHVRAPAPLLRPESNETNPIVISIANLDQVILSKIQPALHEESEETTAATTEGSVDDETTTLVNDD